MRGHCCTCWQTHLPLLLARGSQCLVSSTASVLYTTVLYTTVLYSTVLYCTVQYSTVLYCTELYCTVLYCTVLYCTVLLRVWCLQSGGFTETGPVGDGGFNRTHPFLCIQGFNDAFSSLLRRNTIRAIEPL